MRSKRNAERGAGRNVIGESANIRDKGTCDERRTCKQGMFGEDSIGRKTFWELGEEIYMKGNGLYVANLLQKKSCGNQNSNLDHCLYCFGL